MEMEFKKADDVGQSTKISEEELEHGEIHVEVEHVDAQLHNPDEVGEEENVIVKDEETDNDYLLERDGLRRVIKPP